MRRFEHLASVQTSAPESENPIAQLIGIRTELRALAAAIAGLRADLRQRGVTRANGAQTALISAARAAYRGRTFISADLLTAALRTDATGVQLWQLLTGMSARAVGKALAAASEKRTGDGLILRRVGDSSAGAIWCVTIE